MNPSVKNQRFLPAPFGKGAFGVHRPKPPLPKGGGLAKPNRGDKRPSGFHMGSYFGKVPPVESLSQKSEIFASSLSQGSLRAVPADNFGGESPLTMRTGIFCESLLPLQCPVSLLRWRWICRPKPPLPKVVLPLAKPGGFRGSQVSTWVCAFGKCLP